MCTYCRHRRFIVSGLVRGTCQPIQARLHPSAWSHSHQSWRASVHPPATAAAATSYCPQFDAVTELLTVTENLLLHGALAGFEGGAGAEVVRAALVSGGLEPYRDRLAGKLSYGNRRKLSLAIALLGDRPLLCLDEPSSTLCRSGLSGSTPPLLPLRLACSSRRLHQSGGR